jgi:anti-sigma factor RsiW
MNQSPYDAFEDDLKAFLDGELPWLRQVQVRLHLSRCAHCAQELKTMQTVSEELQTEATAPLEADLRAKILQNLPEAIPLTAQRVPLRQAVVMMTAVPASPGKLRPARARHRLSR